MIGDDVRAMCQKLLDNICDTTVNDAKDVIDSIVVMNMESE